jgi:uncharacterized protein (TIGR02266 family)
VDANQVTELVAEFVLLNRRRLTGNPPLSVVDQQRWSELRDQLSWHLGQKQPLRDEVDRALRVPTQLKIRYGSSGENTASLCNLSEGGLFIRSDAPPAPGTPLRLALDPGDGKAELDLEAVVIWRRELETLDGPSGFGVQFRNLEADDLPGLMSLIERALHEATGV